MRSAYVNWLLIEEASMPNRALNVHAKSIANELELILKLLGGTAEERLRAMEILTGITSVAVTHVVATQLEATAQSLHSARLAMATLKENAKGLSV
jgi:hypothetical protein